MSQEPIHARPEFHINLPADQVEGHYADFATVWHNQETFVLDFMAMTKAPTVTRDDQGQQVARIESQVVTRVRIPASQVWEVMKALEKQLGAWEVEKSSRPTGSP